MLYLFKFVYGKTGDRNVIDEAVKFKSAKIRSWAGVNGAREAPEKLWGK